MCVCVCYRTAARECVNEGGRTHRHLQVTIKLCCAYIAFHRTRCNDIFRQIEFSGNALCSFFYFPPLSALSYSQASNLVGYFVSLLFSS